MLIFKNLFNFEYGWCFAILCRQMLLPWQMLVPNDIVADVIALVDVITIFLYYIMVADVIATRKMFHPFITAWQMLLLYDIVVDVKTIQVVCYNICLAGVICQVADGTATVGWMYMVGVNTNWQMEQPRDCSI